MAILPAYIESFQHLGPLWTRCLLYTPYSSILFYSVSVMIFIHSRLPYISQLLSAHALYTVINLTIPAFQTHPHIHCSSGRYSSHPQIQPSYLPRNCGLIKRGGLWWEGEANALIVAGAKTCGHIREGGLCWEWPLREGPLYIDFFCPAIPGIDNGDDIDPDLLAGIYDRIRQVELKPGSDHVSQVMKVEGMIVGKKPVSYFNTPLPPRYIS